jgi:hypothetical protein
MQSVLEFFIFDILIFYWKRIGHNTYEIWRGLKHLKGIFLGKTYVHSECTGSLIHAGLSHLSIIHVNAPMMCHGRLDGALSGAAGSIG